MNCSTFCTPFINLWWQFFHVFLVKYQPVSTQSQADGSRNLGDAASSLGVEEEHGTDWRRLPHRGVAQEGLSSLSSSSSMSPRDGRRDDGDWTSVRCGKARKEFLVPMFCREAGDTETY
ncbi:uncharacterized protein LOC118188089 [Stegodyphus dumicola]|uniref:uncharacterized protein LOC118188089 n=1 Tax=Stegodyphus dumicola TaxID=202533 RepID=UPI0015AAD9B5|nr:uncharacterized protein LOC118188089 [Stegodyphus dumicola]